MSMYAKKRFSRAFWLWIQFDKKSSFKINKIQKQAIEKFNSPLFESHLTLSGPLNYPKDDLIKLLENFKGQKRFNLYTNSYGYSNQYFESIYIKIEREKKLLI